MRNVHVRTIGAPIERVRPFVESSWTGTRHDPFPRDVLPTWRKNPPGVDPLALIPKVTRLGHGMFSFRFDSWDGERWRVTVENPEFRGWHGFDLVAKTGACRLTHTIELDMSRRGAVLWSVFIAPIHDWCVEAIFDRIEEALVTGVMPETTRRPMPWLAAVSFALLRETARLRPSTRKRPKSDGPRATP
jgi:hypothetical protein